MDIPITKPDQGNCEDTIPGVTLFYIAGRVPRPGIGGFIDTAPGLPIFAAVALWNVRISYP